MDVQVIQQNLGSALIDLEQNLKTLLNLDPIQANIQIQQLNQIILDTQTRLSKVSINLTSIEQNINDTTINNKQKQTQEVIQNLTSTPDNIGINAMGNNQKMKKFNLSKTAQMANTTDFMPTDDGLLENENTEFSNNSVNQAELTREDFTNFLQQIAQEDPNKLFQFVKEHSPIENEENIDVLTKQFNNILNDPTQIDEIDKIAGQIYDLLDDDIKAFPPNSAIGIKKTIAETEKELKKIAKTIADSKSIKNKTFNLIKTAQHKTIDNNVLLYGPHNMRMDPFYRQPVSDWHFVERNKGFGLVVDDIFDIDYESIWRNNIMDKYSRPYRDKEGNWVGGYIEKRFEVDKNIPTLNNYQLKPNELRKPRLPEYGSTESRLQAARNAKTIEGEPDMNTDKPFNWKKASTSKKKVIADLAPIKQKDPFEIKSPFDDNNATQAKKTCIECGSNLGENDFACPNCGSHQNNIGQAHPAHPSQKGPQFNPYSNDPNKNPLHFQKGKPLTSSSKNSIKMSDVEDTNKKKKNKKENIIPYQSEDFLQCIDPSEFQNNKKDDIDNITKSCLDLEIDG